MSLSSKCHHIKKRRSFFSSNFPSLVVELSVTYGAQRLSSLQKRARYFAREVPLHPPNMSSRQIFLLPTPYGSQDPWWDTVASPPKVITFSTNANFKAAEEALQSTANQRVVYLFDQLNHTQLCQQAELPGVISHMEMDTTTHTPTAAEKPLMKYSCRENDLLLKTPYSISVSCAATYGAAHA